MKHRFFITATGTDIGKTFISAALIRQAKALGKSVMAHKPIVTGWVDPLPTLETSHPRRRVSHFFKIWDARLRGHDGLSSFKTTDTGTLLQSLELPPTPENIDRATPWRFAAPLAPSMAARLENRPIKFDDVVAWSREVAAGPEDVVLIEGVGGVMVPIDDTHTVLDWHEGTGLPALLVVGSYLGTISHTLTALAVLEQRKIPVAGVIVNESSASSVALEATADELRRWTKAPVTTVHRRSDAEGWKSVEELRVVFK